MGLGGMIGSGIFVLIGEGGAVAGSAVWISFLLAGVIALLTGYSYFEQHFRPPRITLASSWTHLRSNRLTTG